MVHGILPTYDLYIDVESPKYWDDKNKYTDAGLKPLEGPLYPLSRLCGTYVWVFNLHCDAMEELPSKLFGNLPGLELQPKSKDKGTTLEGSEEQEVDPSAVDGSFSFEEHGFTFGALEAFDAPQAPNHWDVIMKSNLEDEDKDTDEEVDVEEDDDAVSYEDAYIEVHDVLDDNGHPFISFCYIPMCFGEGETQTLVGKKYTGRIGEGLSDTEKERLGIDLSSEEVERRAKGSKIRPGEPDKNPSTTPAGNKRKLDDNGVDGLGVEDVPAPPKKAAKRNA